MEPNSRILIATGNRQAHDSVAECFEDSSALDAVSELQACAQLLAEHEYNVIFLDLDLLRRGEETLEDGSSPILEDLWDNNPDAEVVVLCTADRVRSAVQVVRRGANSYLIHPVDPSDVHYVVDSINETNRLHHELDSLRDQFWQKDTNHLVTTKSPAMAKIMDAARSVSATNSTVLLTGETGTGKGVLAKLIHQHSTRKNGPFVSVHCGAVPENLVESELFGHEKGAFTGAISQREGKFETAGGGTIFLDEVGTMTPGAQVKLLRVLQDRVFQHVGGKQDIEADVRVIAAANRDLLMMCDQGEFRRDLYYRLSVFPIELPPLRERTEDIPHLIEVFQKRLNSLYGKDIAGVRRSVMKGLESYAWPGNIRELENVIERAYVLETSSMLGSQSFPSDIVPLKEHTRLVALDVTGTLAEMRHKAVGEVEEKYLREKLALHRGKIGNTAREAGITPRQLHKLMTKYKLRKEQFR